MMRRVLPVLVLSGLLGLGLLQACGPSQPNFSDASHGGGAAGGGGTVGSSSSTSTTSTSGATTTSTGATSGGSSAGTSGTAGSGGSSGSVGGSSGSGSTTGQPPYCATLQSTGPHYTVGVTWDLPPNKGCGNFRNEGVTTMRLQTSDGESVDVPCEGINPDAGIRTAAVGHLSLGYWGVSVSAIDASGNILYSAGQPVNIIDGEETVGFILTAGTVAPTCGVPHR